MECVAEFSRLKYTDIPNRGLLATFSSEDASFELHVNLSKLQEVRLAKTKSRNADYDVYAARFVGEGEKVMLTAILHGSQQGVCEPEAITRFQELVSKYGEKFQVTL
ncbi:MAG: hypothetical protein WDW38_009986 [Sanguina aurantia]